MYVWEIRYHGFVGVASSLELDGAERVGGTQLCVFADGPFFRQAVTLQRTLRSVILIGRNAGGQAHVLANETATTAPGQVKNKKRGHYYFLEEKMCSGPHICLLYFVYTILINSC